MWLLDLMDLVHLLVHLAMAIKSSWQLLVLWVWLVSCSSLCSLSVCRFCMNLFILLIYIFSCSCVAAPPPKTLTKEWQEATNERAKEMNLNPITGMCPHSPEFFNLSNAGFFLFPPSRYLIRRLLRQRFRSSKEIERSPTLSQVANFFLHKDQV